MYKVFFNNKAIFLTDEFKNNFLKREGLFYKYHNKEELNDLIILFNLLNHIKTLYIIHDDLEFLRNEFKSLFKKIEAAGGLVKNKENKYLFIFRRGKWDLPKGKVDDGESPEITALREVKEECGLQSLSITRQLISTYHTYMLNENPILKKIYWYEMILDKEEIPTPQIEEDITDIKWFSQNEISQVVENTYPTIIDVLTYYGLIKD